MTHGSQSLTLIAIVYMWEGEWMAKLWNLISPHILKCGNDVEAVHPLNLNDLYRMMKL